MRIRDPGWNKFESGIRVGKNLDPGSGINIRVPQHCSPQTKERGKGSSGERGMLVGEGCWVQCLTCYESSIRSWLYLHLDRLTEILFRLYQTTVEVAEGCFEQCLGSGLE
jgi:hypothetical protein